MLKIFEIVVLFCCPALIIVLTKRVKILGTIGPITISYVLGFLFALIPVPYDKPMAQDIASIMVALAIPLVLFGFDVMKVRRLAKKTAVSFALMIFSVMLTASAAACIAFHAGDGNAFSFAGMATGLYVGGTPNMFAVGYALLKDPACINAVNISDSIVGGAYFLLILTVLAPLYRRFLGSGVPDGSELPNQSIDIQGEYDFESVPRTKRGVGRLLGTLLLAALCLGIGACLEILINGDLSGSLYIMITVSVLGIAFSFIKPVREVKGTYQIGQYFILVFSLGLSMSIDFKTLAAGIIPTFIFFAGVQLCAAALHLILCRIFRIDGGTALITSTAGIYGPPFIAPVANAYKDQKLIVPGVICGTFGLVAGNVLGIALGKILELMIT